jgi:hypothetical protein
MMGPVFERKRRFWINAKSCPSSTSRPKRAWTQEGYLRRARAELGIQCSGSNFKWKLRSVVPKRRQP